MPKVRDAPETAIFRLSGSLADVPVSLSRSLDPALADRATRTGSTGTGAEGFFLKVPELAAAWVRDGASVEITIASGAAPGDIQWFLDSLVATIVMLQRGDLPLHATTLFPPSGRGAIAFAGPSGIGKSTLAAALMQRGWTLLADDLTRVTNEHGIPVASPGSQHLKLWRDVCAERGIDTVGLERVTGSRDKFVVPSPKSGGASPLVALIELAGDRATAPMIEDLAGGAAFALVSRNTYRVSLVALLGEARRHVAQVAGLVAYCRIGRLIGARRLPPDDLASWIEQAMGLEEAGGLGSLTTRDAVA